MACVIKGYEEAVEKEQLSRNLVYLDQPEIVLGEPIRNITPHLLAVLTALRSPFTQGGAFTHAHASQFIWALHINYSPRSWWHRTKVTRGIRRFALEECRDQILAFLDLTFMDSPSGGGKSEKPIASDIAALVFRFRHDPWRMTEQETRNTPLRKLYQELRCWDRQQGNIPANHSDKMKGDWLGGVNDWIKENPQNQIILDEWNAQFRMLYAGKITQAEFDKWREITKQKLGKN